MSELLSIIIKLFLLALLVRVLFRADCKEDYRQHCSLQISANESTSWCVLASPQVRSHILPINGCKRVSICGITHGKLRVAPSLYTAKTCRQLMSSLLLILTYSNQLDAFQEGTALRETSRIFVPANTRWFVLRFGRRSSKVQPVPR